jgi:hypothetical protein
LRRKDRRIIRRCSIGWFVLLGAAKRWKDLTRSGPENAVIKDGISRPNSLAFLGADRKNTGHGY